MRLSTAWMLACAASCANTESIATNELLDAGDGGPTGAGNGGAGGSDAGAGEAGVRADAGGGRGGHDAGDAASAGQPGAGAGAGGAGGCVGACSPGDIDTTACDGCSRRVCGQDCQWAVCELEPGNQCEHAGGTHWRCCAAGSWQFCLSSCRWSTACEVNSNAACCTGAGPPC